MCKHKLELQRRWGGSYEYLCRRCDTVFRYWRLAIILMVTKGLTYKPEFRDFY